MALDIEPDSDISGAEVMGWLNKKPKNDGTLNLEETVARGLPYKRGKSSLTVGEIRKVIANTTHEKVYSKGEAVANINLNRTRLKPYKYVLLAKFSLVKFVLCFVQISQKSSNFYWL